MLQSYVLSFQHFYYTYVIFLKIEIMGQRANQDEKETFSKNKNSKKIARKQVHNFKGPVTIIIGWMQGKWYFHSLLEEI